MSVWAEAFRKARVVESEGDMMVQDFLENERMAKEAKLVRQRRDEDESGAGADEGGSKKKRKSESRDEGGFHQPRALALFALAQKDVVGHDPKADAELQTLLEQKNVLKGRKKVVDDESLGRQICRKWLKKEYLGLGNGCNAKKEGCKRAHSLPSKITEIHGDYSFKGLPATHRKKILAMLESVNKEKEYKEE